MPSDRELPDQDDALVETVARYLWRQTMDEDDPFGAWEVQAEFYGVLARASIFLIRTHDGAAARAQIEALTAERDEAMARYESNDGLGGAVCSAIREVLNAGEVTKASFIDDHVANAIVERNQARDRVKRLEEALGPFAAWADIYDFPGRGRPTGDDDPAYAQHDARLPGGSRREITVADFRRARALLTPEASDAE